MRPKTVGSTRRLHLNRFVGRTGWRGDLNHQVRKHVRAQVVLFLLQHRGCNQLMVSTLEKKKTGSTFVLNEGASRRWSSRSSNSTLECFYWIFRKITSKKSPIGDCTGLDHHLALFCWLSWSFEAISVTHIAKGVTVFSDFFFEGLVSITKRESIWRGLRWLTCAFRF